jgi:thiol-disulfide isomerase/thioredoxin
MYRLLIVFLLLTGTSVLAQEKIFVLNGSLPVSTKKYTVLLSWNNGNDGEEAKVINGKFTIKGTISKPGIASLMLQEISAKKKTFNRLEFEQNSLNLFIDTGIITVSTKTFLWDADVKGSSVVNDYQNYQQKIKQLLRLESRFGEVYDHYQKLNKKQAAIKVFDLYTGMQDLYYDEQFAFVKENPSSLVSLYLTQEAVGNEMDAAKGEPMFVMLSPALQNSEEGKQLKERITIGKKTMVGVKAIDFSQPDMNGKMISLSSFKGKYVLVDFWASWCGPCRAESPNLVKAYSKYKEKNFEIFGVSLDQSKDKWLKAVNDDQYTWTQVSEVKGWETAVAQEYGIEGIPFNILVDPNGYIVARNLRGEALEKKLKEILK